MTKIDATLHTQQETTTTSSNFNFGFTITDLYRRSGLVKLDQIFLDFLRTGDESLYKKLEYARVYPDELLPKDDSALLIEICLLYTSPSPRDRTRSRMPSSA